MPIFKALGSTLFFLNRRGQENMMQFVLRETDILLWCLIWQETTFPSCKLAKHRECHAQIVSIKLSFPSCKTSLGTQNSRKHIGFLSICTGIYSNSDSHNLQDNRKNKRTFYVCLGPPYHVLATGCFHFQNELAVATWASCLQMNWNLELTSSLIIACVTPNRAHTQQNCNRVLGN